MTTTNFCFRESIFNFKASLF